eukprot:358886-Chlamydomonas_euryale.AAC.1
MSSSTSSDGWLNNASANSCDSTPAGETRSASPPRRASAAAAAARRPHLTCRQCTGGPVAERQRSSACSATSSAVLPLPAAPVTSRPPGRGGRGGGASSAACESPPRSKCTLMPSDGATRFKHCSSSPCSHGTRSTSASAPAAASCPACPAGAGGSGSGASSGWLCSTSESSARCDAASGAAATNAAPTRADGGSAAPTPSARSAPVVAAPAAFAGAATAGSALPPPGVLMPPDSCIIGTAGGSPVPSAAATTCTCSHLTSSTEFESPTDRCITAPGMSGSQHAAAAPLPAAGAQAAAALAWSSLSRVTLSPHSSPPPQRSQRQRAPLRARLKPSSCARSHAPSADAICANASPPGTTSPPPPPPSRPPSPPLATLGVAEVRDGVRPSCRAVPSGMPSAAVADTSAACSSRAVPAAAEAALPPATSTSGCSVAGGARSTRVPPAGNVLSGPGGKLSLACTAAPALPAGPASTPAERAPRWARTRVVRCGSSPNAAISGGASSTWPSGQSQPGSATTTARRSRAPRAPETSSTSPSAQPGVARGTRSEGLTMAASVNHV